jgi:hypothetical protein
MPSIVPTAQTDYNLGAIAGPVPPYVVDSLDIGCWLTIALLPGHAVAELDIPRNGGS